MRMLRFGIPLFMCLLFVSEASGEVLSNTPTGDDIAAFGRPDTQTYGQVFTAPVTGSLDSFTLHLNGFAGDIRGAVGSWNGTPSHDFGFGETSTLYLSSPVTTSAAPSAYTFNPNVNVVAGDVYVAYLTVFGLSGPDAVTTMPLGTSPAGINYFVWNNTTSPFGNPSWDYFFDVGSVLFSASFTPVPEPSSLGFVTLIVGRVGCRRTRFSRNR